MHFKNSKKNIASSLAVMLVTTAGIYNSIDVTSLTTFAENPIKEAIIDRVSFGKNKNLLGNDCIIGMMAACKTEYALERLILVPPTRNIVDASTSIYYMWERTNPLCGRAFCEFFPVYSSGKVDTDIVISACYNEKDIPQNSKLLFSDKKSRFIKRQSKNPKTEEKEMHIFIKKADNNYIKPILNETLVWQLIKKNQQEGTSLHISHGRDKIYDIKEFFENVESSEEIDYGAYAPLCKNDVQKIIAAHKVSCKGFHPIKEKELNTKYKELVKQYNKTCDAFNDDFLNSSSKLESDLLTNLINNEENFITSEIKMIRNSILKLADKSHIKSIKEISSQISRLENDLSKLGHDMLESHCRVNDIKKFTFNSK